METMRKCPGCQRALAPDAPDGLCPKCLIKAGLGTGVDIGPDSRGESGRTPFVAPTPEEVARLFPQLEILGFIGQGGMGAVYRARQKALDRVVALKTLPPGIGKDPAFAERFTREAKALARLNHPGVVTLYEFGQADSLFFFLMEYVDGMVIHWHGVLPRFVMTLALLILLLVAVGAISAYRSSAPVGRIDSQSVGIAFMLAVIFTGILVRRGLTTPVEQLPTLDRLGGTGPKQGGIVLFHRPSRKAGRQRPSRASSTARTTTSRTRL